MNPTQFSSGIQMNKPTASVVGAGATRPAQTFGITGGGDAGGKLPSTGGLGGGFFSNLTSPASTTATSVATSNPLLSFNLGSGTTTATAIATPTTVQPTLTSTVTSTPSLSLAKTTPSTLGVGNVAPLTNLTTETKTTSSSAVSNTSQLSYIQLEEHINKWTLELEEQEKVFTDQATQINAWDNILINNNQKILELNDAVQKVKSEQQTLEQELEFIATQHKELEESIVPLQKEFSKIPQVDVERSQIYLMVENLDTQLKQMSEDLKEIIDNLNESNKGQDNTDPIIQIGKIINALMSSLQWIETSSGNICTKIEDITKMHESFKRESERSFRSAYYN